MDKSDATQYRALVARALDLSQDRSDISYNFFTKSIFLQHNCYSQKKNFFLQPLFTKKNSAKNFLQ